MYAYAWAGITFIFFVAIITIKVQWMKLSLPVKIILIPWGIIGLLLDVLLNLVFSWLFLLSMPREMLFTGHCDRLLNNTKSNAPASGYMYVWLFLAQGKLARSWCKALDLFQQGGHCHAE